jgi:hypothetical protein
VNATTEADAPLIVLTCDMLKARVAEEGGERFVYVEASNEAIDQQNERIKLEALLGSRELFLRQGNLDIDHLTVVGYRVGIPNPHEWEIGLPVDAQVSGGSMWVKGRIYQNQDKADFFWKSLTELVPPMRWHPSVAGEVLERKTIVDPHTKATRRIVTKAKWINLAFSKQPQNLALAGVSVSPIGAFAKSAAWALGERCCDGDTCDGDGACEVAEFAKTVTAGYGTDSATLTGGGALRRQSIQGGIADPWESAGTRLLRGGIGCPHASGHVSIKGNGLFGHFRDCEGMSERDAAGATHAFHDRLLRRRRKRERQKGEAT